MCNSRVGSRTTVQGELGSSLYYKVLEKEEYYMVANGVEVGKLQANASAG